MATKIKKRITFLSEEKKNVSCFIITIGSNSTLDDISLEAFKETVFSKLQEFDAYIQTNPGHEVDKEPIIHLEPVFEVGHKMHRLHVHINCTIRHNSNIRINLPAIKKAFAGYYLHVDFNKGSIDVNKARNYIRKGLKPPAEEDPSKVPHVKKPATYRKTKK